MRNYGVGAAKSPSISLHRRLSAYFDLFALVTKRVSTLPPWVSFCLFDDSFFYKLELYLVILLTIIP